MALVTSGLMNKQIAGRTRARRDHREDPSRAHHEEDGCEVVGRSGENGRSARNSSHQALIAQGNVFRGTHSCWFRSRDRPQSGANFLLYKPKYDFGMLIGGSLSKLGQC